MRRKYFGALVAAILVVGACGASPSIAPSGSTVEITVGTDSGAELKFEPGEVSVPAGADVRLTFENRSTVPHNLTFQRPPNVATSTVVAAGTSETLEFKAPAPGEYAFVCTLHPGMAGTLLVEGD
jgi:plastocyanin